MPKKCFKDIATKFNWKRCFYQQLLEATRPVASSHTRNWVSSLASKPIVFAGKSLLCMCPRQIATRGREIGLRLEDEAWKINEFERLIRCKSFHTRYTIWKLWSCTLYMQVSTQKTLINQAEHQRKIAHINFLLCLLWAHSDSHNEALKK